MRIARVDLIHVRLPLVHPFETSFGRETERDSLLVRIEADGMAGWGECPASAAPLYSYETVETARHVLRDFLVPALKGRGFERAESLEGLFGFVRGHNMAKACVEGAVLDWFGRATGRSASDILGGTRREIEVGVSLGIEADMETLLARVGEALEAGYRRIKVKIKPGWDIKVVAAVRDRFGEIPLMVDANGAYSLADAEHLQKLDAFDLMMIEQPLGYEDHLDHAALQRRLRTPICLDESIRSPEDGRRAIEVGACRIVNIKPARVGGPWAAKRLHDLCAERGVPVWCGGLLETGIGRAHNIAVASLPNFLLPGDLSASDRYYREEIIDPPVTLGSGGRVEVSDRPGMGYNVVESRVERVEVRRERILL